MPAKLEPLGALGQAEMVLFERGVDEIALEG